MIIIHYGAKESLLIFVGNKWTKAFNADSFLYIPQGRTKQMPFHSLAAQQAERSSAQCTSGGDA